MKNKKNQKKGKYLLGLLVGVVALGIGYATITNITLSITGNAKANGTAVDSDFVVRFVQTTDAESEVTAVSAAAANPTSYNVVTGEEITASTEITADDEATFNVTGMVTGDEVTFTYYIANLSDGLKANVTPTLTNNNTENFTVTMTPVEAFTLAEDAVQEVTVTVECISQNLLDTKGTFTISFEAEATE